MQFLQFLCDLTVGESGEEVLYGTTDGQIGLVQLSRFYCIVMFTMSLFILLALFLSHF